MRFKMAGKFKTTTTNHRITDIMHSQSKYIPGVTDEYNAKTRANATLCYKPAFASAKLECQIAIAAKKMDRSRRAWKARQVRY